MNIKELAIAGCYQITPSIFKDDRGVFTKTFHSETLAEYNLNIELKEEFFSISKKNVLRGLHFQSPPSAHNKLVYCPKGAVLDFFLDIRIGSETYGEYLSIELNDENSLMLFLPIGIAHGFLSLKEDTLMIYKTDCSYDPGADGGLNFSSCNIELPIDFSDVIVSKRDLGLPDFKQFISPFK
jgi:dTDP-4-dehydrorhamnose 3,5-epimerase